MDKGIIFSAPMVRALLDGRKTQTRRLLKDAPKGGRWHCDRGAVGLRWVADGGSRSFPCRTPYATGDRLYVRENFYQFGGPVAFAADGPPEFPRKMTSCIHMPRWASRLTLLVADVRVQRVAEISQNDAKAEGVNWRSDYGYSPRDHFCDLWNSLHDKPGERWSDNPWVVTVTFEVKHGNIDRIEP